VATQLWRDDENLKRQHCYDLTLDTTFAFPSLAPSNWQPGQKIDGSAPAPSIMPRSHLDGRDPLGETQFGAPGSRMGGGHRVSALSGPPPNPGRPSHGERPAESETSGRSSTTGFGWPFCLTSFAGGSVVMKPL
jgi:hypothetical protein